MDDNLLYLEVYVKSYKNKINIKFIEATSNYNYQTLYITTDDNCKCIVYYVNHTNSVVLYQTHLDGNSSDDYISIDDFKEYLK